MIYIIIITCILLLYIIKNKRKIENFKNITFLNIYYINLDSRKDRKLQIETELQKLDIINNIQFKINRFSAMKSNIHGGIGCGKSHINILKKAKKDNLPYVMIIEDDLIVRKENLITSFNLIQKLSNWDVFIFSGQLNSKNHTENKNNSIFKRAKNIQTTGWYIIKKHYYDKLINVFTESVNNMEKLHTLGKNINYRKWAIDQNWKKLQEKDNWYIFKRNIGYQKEDYSDIERKKVNYIKLRE
jgi:glycosyl transferase, family 25